MYGQEQRKLVVETFIKFDHSCADAIAELGYPMAHALRGWWKEYERTGEVPASKFETNPRYTDEQKRAAVEHYPEHGKGLARTMRALGHPKSREILGEWIDEIAPGRRKCRGPNPKKGAVPIEKKVKVVAELEARTGPAAKVAERHGVSRTAPYAWRREIMGDNGGEPEGKGGPVSEELDVRQAALEIVKKDPGADPGRPTDAEKAAMAAALRAKHRLCELLPVVGMAKSSYEYARNAQAKGESEKHAATGGL